jgi:Zn-dependent alcohol dehydrogenase
MSSDHVRAAVLSEVGASAPYTRSKPLTIQSLELAPPGPAELHIAVRAAGLCHSDLSVIDGSRPRVMPMVLGHEAAGEVLEVGPGVSAFAPGDHVVLAFVPVCGDCGPCRAGRVALCEPGAAANTAGTLLSGHRRFTNPGTDTQPHHHLGVSAFAERIVVSEHSAIKIDPELPFELAALFGCAVLTGAGAALNATAIRPGDSVAIFGLGGVGLAALLAAVDAGAAVIAVDRVPAKLELASELGAAHAVPANDDIVAHVRELTNGGAAHAIETVGSAAVLQHAYAATRRGGTTVTVGLPDPSQLLSISAVSLVAEERTLKGSYLGSCVPDRDIPRFIELYRAGRLPVDRLLTHRLTLDQLNEGFDRLASGEAVRQVVMFER